MKPQSYSPVGLESNTYTQKPEYNLDLLKTNHAYRYSKVDEFTTYMETIEPYNERVVYYIDIAQAMGLTVSYPACSVCELTTTVPVFERECQLIDVEGGYPHFVDKSGKRVGYKEWRLPAPVVNYERYGEDEALRRKIWFEKGGYTSFSKYGIWENEHIADRKARYDTGSKEQDLRVYAKQRHKEIKRQIAQLHTEYIAGLRSDASAKLRVQIEDAPKRIEAELLGERAIDWLAFERYYDLQLFGVLWDMVRFKLFLEEQTGSSVSPINPPVDTKDALHEGIAGQGDISQRALALFVWYCQETGELPRFQEGNKKQGWKAITAPYGNSANAFKNHLTPMQHPKSGYAYRTSDLPALQDVVDRLKKSKKCPLALAMAERELYQAKLNSPT